MGTGKTIHVVRRRCGPIHTTGKLGCESVQQKPEMRSPAFFIYYLVSPVIKMFPLVSDIVSPAIDKTSLVFDIIPLVKDDIPCIDNLCVQL